MPFIRDTRNEWGRQGGPNPQRSDLWQVDLTSLVRGLNNMLGLGLANVPAWHIATIDVPELQVKSEPTRRDNQSYEMPSWDEPVGAITLSFIMDDGGIYLGQGSGSMPRSEIYTLLDGWRRLVRSGRGAVGSEREPLPLDANYRSYYRYNISVFLVRGISPPRSVSETTLAGDRFRNNDSSSMFPQSSGNSPRARVTPASTLSTDMLVASSYVLEHAWLSSFKIGSLTYDGSSVKTLDATLYAANIKQDTTVDSVINTIEDLERAQRNLNTA